MGIVALILVILFLLFVFSRIGRTRRMDRGYRHGTVAGVRTVRRHGRITPVRLCPDCGEPVTKCRRRVKDAQHAEGMLGKRKK